MKKYPKSTVLAGDDASVGLVIVMKGVAGVYKSRNGKKELVSTLGPGSLFGGESLFLEKGAADTLTALTDVIALPIERKETVSFFREEPETAFEITKEFCARLEGVCSAYEKLTGHPWSEITPAAAKPPAAKAEPAPAPAAPAAARKAGAGSTPQAKSHTAPQPASPAAAAQPGAAFPLFPEGHGSYALKLNCDDRTFLMEKGSTCPMCKKEFKALAARTSRLVEESTDSDMRHRYRGVEPLYFDVATCPHCLYSALGESFSHPDNHKADLSDLQALKAQAAGMFGSVIDASSVFASYYLALLCAPKCFAKHQWATAKLLLKLSRVYQDAGDEAMMLKTAKQALDAYLYIYLNEQSDPNEDQQLCIILGELYLKLGDHKNAREYFFKAKTNRMGAPLLKNHAETRISDIRALEEKA